MMEFHRSRTDRERWSAYCRSLGLNADDAGPFASALKDPARIEQVLSDGCCVLKGREVPLSSLPEEEWLVFESFLAAYRTEWQTYFEPMVYPGYFDERDRRGLPPLPGVRKADA